MADDGYQDGHYSDTVNLVWKPMVLCFAVGFLSHLATDIFNRKRVRLFYPLEGGVALGLFHAHGAANQVFFMAGCLATAIEVLLFVRRLF